MMHTRNVLLNYPLLVLNKLGLYSETQTKLVIIIALVYVIVHGFYGVIALLQFLHIERISVFAIATNMEAIVGFFQVIGKIIVLIYKRKTFAKLVDDTLLFWSTDKCENRVKVKLNNILSIILRLQKLYLRAVVLTLCVLCLTPIFGNSLAIGIWNMKDNVVLFRLVAASQAITYPVIGLFMSAFDNLFLSFCIITIIQFRILCHCVKDLSVSDDPISPEEEYFTRMRLCIKHHMFLLRFTSTLRSVYSVPLLLQFISSSPLICGEIYAVFEGEHLQDLLRHSAVGVCLIVQLAFYCIPADYVTSEASAVSDALYDSDWYSQHLSFVRNTATLVIQNSQKETPFRAGGLVEINARTLINVLRVSWSTCTLLRAMK